ncbi:MAG: aspartate kinase [Bacteroidota bacterium]|nr:aspartate kinase [Bacteroidota bacterium]MDX5428671.1 aspartate kinase [Bacteroidota bacterium]MDX5447017.1 aspartate kinase [Bacteroidota bacterium]MDX5506399.1 aspartate kinase [Bacteroidota bacterium]
MKPLRDRLQEYLEENPFLEEALHNGLLNLSAVARSWKDRLDRDQGESVSEASVIMALRRMEPTIPKSTMLKLKQFTSDFGDIIVRSDLADFTFNNSPTIASSQSEFLRRIKDQISWFYTFSKGVSETTIIISRDATTALLESFSNERMTQQTLDLASITIMLPQASINTMGLYYYIFRTLTLRGINICEVISTTNEFTLVVSKKDIEKSFEVIHQMRK